jgi:hypothetical protein
MDCGNFERLRDLASELHLRFHSGRTSVFGGPMSAPRASLSSPIPALSPAGIFADSPWQSQRDRRGPSGKHQDGKYSWRLPLLGRGGAEKEKGRGTLQTLSYHLTKDQASAGGRPRRRTRSQLVSRLGSRSMAQRL